MSATTMASDTAEVEATRSGVGGTAPKTRCAPGWATKTPNAAARPTTTAAAPRVTRDRMTGVREDVSDRLMADWEVDATDIEVAVASGEVTLSGTVGDRQSKRRAENIAANVLGVKDVQNNLRVRKIDPFATGREVGAMTQGSNATTPASGSTASGTGTTTTGTATQAKSPLRHTTEAG